ncbi:hypothetical protein AVEN_274102-1, partial [Araneus ventricosus]
MHVGLVLVKSDVASQTYSIWCGEEVWIGVTAQVSPSSSDHDSKLQ